MPKEKKVGKQSGSRTEPKASLRTSEDVFQRLSHDPDWSIVNIRVRIGYWDRLVAGYLETPLQGFTPISKGGDLPWHRVWWFRLEVADADTNADDFPQPFTAEDLLLSKSLLWDREARHDLVFRSGDTDQIMQMLKRDAQKGKHSALHATWAKNIDAAISNVQAIEEERQHLREVKQKEKARKARNAASAASKQARASGAGATAVDGQQYVRKAAADAGMCMHSDTVPRSGHNNQDLGFTFSEVKVTRGGAWPHPSAGSATAVPTRKKFRMVSQNVLMDIHTFTDSHESAARWSKLLDFLALEDADFYVLQEVTATFCEVLDKKLTAPQGDDAVGDASQDTFWTKFGYACCSLDQSERQGSSYSYGQLILSRWPLIGAGELDLGNQKRALFCEVAPFDESSQPLLLCGVHLTSDHHSENASKRLFQLAQVRHFVKQYVGVRGDAEVVVAGDFNEDSLVLPEVRTAEEEGGREGKRALLQGYDNLSDDDADAVIRRAGKVLNFLELCGEELVGAAARHRLSMAASDLQPSFAPEVNPLARENATQMRPRRIDHVFFSDGVEQCGVARALAPCIRSPAGSEWLYLSDHSAVTFDFALGPAPTRGTREAGGLLWLTSCRKTVEKPWGLAWLVPDAIEPVEQGLRPRVEREHDKAGRLEPVAEARSLLYCSTCSTSCEVKVVEEACADAATLNLHGRIGAFFEFVQSVRKTSDASFHTWNPHVTLFPPVIDISLESVAQKDLADYLNVPDSTSKEDLARESLHAQLEALFSPRDLGKRLSVIFESLRQCPLGHTEWVPGVLEHGRSASVVLYPVGETQARLHSIYKTLHEDVLPPSSAGKFGTARVDAELFEPHLTLASDLSQMEANALVGGLRQRMRDAFQQKQRMGGGPSLERDDALLAAMSGVVASSSERPAVGGDDLILVGPPLTFISAMQADGGVWCEAKRLHLRGWPVPQSAGALSSRILASLKLLRLPYDILPVGSAAIGLDDAATSDLDLAVQRVCPIKESSAHEILADIKRRLDQHGAVESGLKGVYFSDLCLVEDAQVPILRTTAFCGARSKLVEIQVGLSSFDFNLQLRSRILSVVYARQLDYQHDYLDPLRASRLWAQSKEVYGQIYGFPPGIFWSLLVLDGALISSIDKENCRTPTERMGSFDAVFQHILCPAHVEGFFSKAFVLPGGTADALRNLTAFTRPVVVEAVKNQGAGGAQYWHGEHQVGHDVNAESSSFEEISRQLFGAGLTHIVMISATPAERFEKSVLRLAGDLYFEAKCAKVRPFAVRNVHCTTEGEQQEARQVFVIGLSIQACKSKIPTSADDLVPELDAVREVAQRWSANLLPADDFLRWIGDTVGQ